MLNINKKESKGYYQDVFYLQMLATEHDFDLELEETKRGNLVITCTVIDEDQREHTDTIIIAAKDKDEVLLFLGKNKYDTTWYY